MEIIKKKVNLFQDKTKLSEEEKKQRGYGIIEPPIYEDLNWNMVFSVPSGITLTPDGGPGKLS